MPRIALALLLVSCTSRTSPPASNPEPAPVVQPTPVAQPVVAPPVGRDPVSMILPGDSVGPVTASTTRADLGARLGAEALSDESVHIGEGQMAEGTLVHGGTDHELRVTWTDATRTTVDHVQIIGSAWQLPGELHIGATFSEVQAALGPFELVGFGTDGGGLVRLGGTKLAAHASTLTLHLSLPEGALSIDGAGSVMGDSLVASDTPVLQTLQLTLSGATARF